MSAQPRILIISHVWPVPGVSGQEKRVYYMLKALSSDYRVTFLTVGDRKKRTRYNTELHQLCDEAIVLPSRYNANVLTRLLFKALSQIYSAYTGLKASNFAIGLVELSKARVRKAIKGASFEAVIFEYWHAHHAADTSVFGTTPVILDMHNILWQTYKTQTNSSRVLQKYKAYEERVWDKFHYLIAINQNEAGYVKEERNHQGVWYIPMGIDLARWPEGTGAAKKTARIAWYGGLASVHNQRDAMRVYEEVMPDIWKRFPNIEFWIIGSKPPQHIKELSETDARVTVTGFIEDVAPVLGSTDLILCPWQGTYGFRSRLIEVMATGTPVITTEDAASGMDLEHGEGILFNDNLEDWSDISIDLLNAPERLQALRKKARKAVETQYSLQATYDQLPKMVSAIKR